MEAASQSDSCLASLTVAAEQEAMPEEAPPPTPARSMDGALVESQFVGITSLLTELQTKGSGNFMPLKVVEVWEWKSSGYELVGKVSSSFLPASPRKEASTEALKRTWPKASGEKTWEWG